MSQRNSSFPWTLNQNTLKALSCSKENTLRTQSFASPWYSGNKGYNQHTDAIQGQDCYIVEQSLNVNPNQRIGPQQRQAKDSCCYRNDSHGIIKDMDTFKFKKRGYREDCGEEETEQLPAMFDRVTSPATGGDWSGSDSDLLILNLPSPRETTQHASTPETTPFCLNYPVKGSKQHSGANCLEKSDNFRKTKEASHCASTPEPAFSLSYPDKGFRQHLNSYGSNYSEKSEKLRKAEREMELFLFGCAGCPTMAAKENISPNKPDEINGNIKFMENSNVGSIDTTLECKWRNSDESARKVLSLIF